MEDQIDRNIFTRISRDKVYFIFKLHVLQERGVPQKPNVDKYITIKTYRVTQSYRVKAK